MLSTVNPGVTGGVTGISNLWTVRAASNSEAARCSSLLTRMNRESTAATSPARNTTEAKWNGLNPVRNPFVLLISLPFAKTA